ncbi:MAG: ABC transporter ATP-binding protein [Coriobacteriia bacterium]|nr:ABC transporter ATP-binding protein [Coriobacteriia bacterium]
MLTRITGFLNEYLRINAVRRMLTIVDIKTSEVVGLVVFAVIFAVFEGIGISLLLPVLQYAEGGQTAIVESSGPIWVVLARFMELFNLPVTLPVLLVMAFTPILMRQVVFYFNTWYSAVVSSRIGIRMRMQTLDTVLNADPEFFGRHPVGKLVGIVISQTGAAGAAILAVIKQLSITLLMLLYVAILLAISVPLTAITLVFAILVSMLIKANIRKIRDFAVESAAISQEMMGKIVERLGLTRLIKLRDQKQVESDRIRDFSETMRAIGVKQARLGARIEVTADPLLMLSVFITLYIGISVLGMTLAQLGLVLFVLSRLNAKVKEFNAGRQMISQNMAGLLLVKEMTEEATASNRIRGGALPFEDLKRELVLTDVTFDYPDAYAADGTLVSKGKSVLKGVSIIIPAGSFTALVGRSGAGKSTLVELLPRLRDATSGTITYDGTDIKDFQVGSLRKGVGYLTQSAMLFNDTVRENLVYGLDYEPTEEQMRTALEQAYATFVYDLPSGLETKLGDRGVRFSGGERQRIGLARVLLADTSLLILDEPTSALDSESEAYIQKALADLHGTKTIIVIAHRLATVIQADQLLVVEDGHIVERGTHAELVTKGATYQKLFETQLLA